MSPIKSPPTVPMTRMGTRALVMRAEGKLSRTPKVRPMAQLGQGRPTRLMTMPMLNRSMNAAVIAARLSANDILNIGPIARAPSSVPDTKP